ncbi:NAD(P)-dependent oxidoreductase [Brachybacterium sp. AOP43-C2-M15]|uniref:NAD(P)-dependent oxidoreductase n=1 Tax=Brachybacterium sp. AOP43-C2-M15 TaxID=3457661 RepID=UPI0040345BCD
MSRSVDAVVVGLGAMGLPMARGLAAAGLEVVGVETSTQRRADAADLATVGSLAQAPPSAAVLVMVATPEQLSSVVDDALRAGSTEATWILSGTLGTDAVLEQTERLRTIGARAVDAPVTGGVAGATAGTLVLFVGGADEDIAAAQPVLRALGTPEVVGGRIGDGQMMKMVNQHLCSIHLAAAAEALVLAGRLGLDQQRVLDLLGRGGAASWMLADRGPRMLTPPETVNSSVDVFVKDSHLVQTAAERVDAPTPVLAAARGHFVDAHRRGAGSADDSQIFAVLDSPP